MDRNSNIQVATGKASWVSILNLRGIPIALPSLEENPKRPLQLDNSHDVTEQTRVLKGHHHRNSRRNPRFLPQLKKNHETCPSPQDEPRFTCIAWREIPCSTSIMKGALTSFMELQRVPKITITSLEKP